MLQARSLGGAFGAIAIGSVKLVRVCLRRHYARTLRFDISIGGRFRPALMANCTSCRNPSRSGAVTSTDERNRQS